MFHTPTIGCTGRSPTGAKLALKPVQVWGIRVWKLVFIRTRSQRRADNPTGERTLPHETRLCLLR